MHTFECKQCGRQFEARRSDAKYCPGGRCRKAAARRRAQIERLGQAAEDAISDMRNLVKLWPDLALLMAVEESRLRDLLGVPPVEGTDTVTVPAYRTGQIALLEPKRDLPPLPSIFVAAEKHTDGAGARAAFSGGMGNLFAADDDEWDD